MRLLVISHNDKPALQLWCLIHAVRRLDEGQRTSLSNHWRNTGLLNRHRSLCPGDRASLIWSFPESWRCSWLIYLLFFSSKRLWHRQGVQPCPFNQDSVQQSGLAPVHGTSREKKDPCSQKSAWPGCWIGFATSSPKERLSSGHQRVSFGISHPHWSELSSNSMLNQPWPDCPCLRLRLVHDNAYLSFPAHAWEQCTQGRKKTQQMCLCP